jgi:hypothetical protein
MKVVPQHVLLSCDVNNGHAKHRLVIAECSDGRLRLFDNDQPVRDAVWDLSEENACAAAFLALRRSLLLPQPRSDA